MVDILQIRPARRLVAIEACGAILFAAVTLPFTQFDADSVPEWTQLLGLVLLLSVFGLNLHTWRKVVSGGLAAYGSQALARASRFEDQLADEKRLRVVAMMYVVSPVLLIPIPSTWVRFWFGFTVVTALLATVSLIALVRSEVRRGHRR
ncbi:hypothetical protein [Mycolicibacterium frederiksbergense]|uniref:hypothetical protein n=1 Tax=Mycolicibacterium frederiksbergense TaxID=117567 RepID=UPI00247551F5|nr:hypothetical protein [Mycolicibacterium frederiksbergense]